MNYAKVTARGGDVMYVNLDRIDLIVFSGDECTLNVGTRSIEVGRPEERQAILERLRAQEGVGSTE